MDQGRLFQAFCLQILLLALAIQGITPDAEDLASVNALKFFCPALTDPDTTVEEDEFPDDVCEPVRLEIELGRCQLADIDGLPLSRSATGDVEMGRAKSESLSLAAPHFTNPRIDGLIHFVCRLKC
jgi:hypothetical protein